MSNIKNFYPQEEISRNQKTAEQAELEKHKAAFFAKGGRIEIVPDGCMDERQKTMKELDNVNWNLNKDKQNSQIQSIVDTHRQSEKDRAEAEKRARRQAQGRI